MAWGSPRVSCEDRPSPCPKPPCAPPLMARRSTRTPRSRRPCAGPPRKRCDLAIRYIVSPALDNAQRTVFLEDGCRLVGVLLELLAVGSRHCGYESVDVGHDVSPITSGCCVTLAIYCRLKRFSRPIGQRYACVVSFPAPVASTALTILAQRLLYSSGRRDQTLCDKFSRMVRNARCRPRRRFRR